MKKDKTAPRKKSVIREYAEAFIIALILALIIRTFIIQAFKIPSGSMLPTLQIGDYILVNKFVYYFRAPKRGEIIVFKFPLNEKRDFIKRVIGLPGEEIQLKNRQVYINGKPIPESYTASSLHSPQDAPGSSFGPFKVPDDSFFVMGDNRDNSMDSRIWGAVNKSKIKGKAFVIYWTVKPICCAGMSIWKSFLVHILTLRDRIRWQRIGHLVN